MSRSLSLALLLLSLVVGGYLLTTQLKREGPTSQVATHAETLAVQAAASANFSAADAAIQAYFAANATYAGATLDPSYQVTLVRGDTSSYCLQAVVNGQLQHEVGPGGTTSAGSC
jgi:hypothetical protein